MNGLLHLGLEILDAHAEPVESQAAQRFEMRAIGDARIDFDADFGVRREREALARVHEKVFHLRGREIGGRAAAPVELDHAAVFRNPAGHVLDFLLQRGEVGNGDALVLLDRDVARAKQAQAFAEGKMHVERKRRAPRLRRARNIFRGRRGRNRPSRPARWDSSCSAARDDCTSREFRRRSGRSRACPACFSFCVRHF